MRINFVRVEFTSLLEIFKCERKQMGGHDFVDTLYLDFQNFFGKALEGT